MAQNLSAAGAAFTRAEEGFVDHWYSDPTGTGTIGVGFTWASAAFRDWWGRNRPGQKFGRDATMTRAEADDCLTYLFAAEYGAAVAKFLGRDVAQHVFDGMGSAVFNMGAGSLQWKWAASIKEGDLHGGAVRLKVTGTTSKGVPLRGLEDRRREEAELIEFGDYTIGKGANRPADPMRDGILRRSERGQAVGDLQRSLAAAGHYTGNIDGVFGFGTEAAVMAFQRAHNLDADGVAGPKTLDALKAAVPTAGQASQAPSATVIGVGLGAAIGALIALAKSKGWLP